ncbi:hypothetical protein TNCV_904351 [Trichonephila clavipes]|nr:hypothetical protein TNCV_904351 [Trichonephila clavipes]
MGWYFNSFCITCSHEGIVTVLESDGEVDNDGLTVMLSQDQIRNEGRRNAREFLVDGNGTQMRRDGLRDTGLDGIVPSPPGSAVNLAVVQHMGDGLSGIAAFAATGITPAEPFSGIKLENTKAGAMDEVPIAKSSIMAPLDKMV